jgi:hypothetical protein
MPKKGGKLDLAIASFEQNCIAQRITHQHQSHFPGAERREGSRSLKF